MPPAFALSQDQTLRFIPEPMAHRHRPQNEQNPTHPTSPQITQTHRSCHPEQSLFEASLNNALKIHQNSSPNPNQHHPPAPKPAVMPKPRPRNAPHATQPRPRPPPTYPFLNPIQFSTNKCRTGARRQGAGSTRPPHPCQRRDIIVPHST